MDMKILWICNVPNNEAAEKFGFGNVNIGGWLTGLSMNLSNIDEIELYYAFPMQSIDKIVYNFDNNIKYIAYPYKNIRFHKYDKTLESVFLKIKDDINPDLVHVFGTEYPSTLAAIRVFDKDKVVISIQGMTSVLQNYYYADLPSKVLKKRTLLELMRYGNITAQRKRFYKSGVFEREAILNSKYIIGRTQWDYSSVNLINPQVEYYHADETLRKPFYSNEWDISKIDRHSIFVSQATYPIKGFHYLLRVMPKLIDIYPEIKVYISGTNVITENKKLKILKISSYSDYIRKQIKVNNLSKHIIFLGSINADKMKEKFLKSHVFLCPSSIENSPNALGEAMILGVPSIASYVGGIPSMIDDNVDGLLYQHNSPEMLVEKIKNIFNDDNLATKLSLNARKRALRRHDENSNAQRLLEIYNNILNNQNNGKRGTEDEN